jgi:tetratricopeptide (TPR) repeat protein
LASLSRSAFDLLAAGAVLGESFAFEPLRSVAAQEEAEALTAPDEVLAAGHLPETEERDQPYGFTHHEIRAVVLDQISAARRQHLQGIAFEHLRERGAPPAELARHAQSTGAQAEAFRYGLAAGDAALDLFAVNEAVSNYEKAARLPTEHPHLQVDSRSRMHLYSRLGRAYEILGSWEKAAETYRRIIQMNANVNDPERASLTRTRLAFVTAQRHDIQRAQKQAQQALTIAENSGLERSPAEEAHWCSALLGLYAGDVSAMGAHGERALELAREVGDQELIGRCLNILAYDKRNQGRAETGIRFAEQALETYRELGDLVMEKDFRGPWLNCF